MRYLNGWHPFESIRFDLVKIAMWRCLILQIWEQQKQLLRKQRVIQKVIMQANHRTEKVVSENSFKILLI